MKEKINHFLHLPELRLLMGTIYTKINFCILATLIGRTQIPSRSCTLKTASLCLALLMGGMITSFYSCKNGKAQRQRSPTSHRLSSSVGTCATFQTGTDSTLSTSASIILERIHRYLVKDDVLYDQLFWDKEGIKIFSRATDNDSGLAAISVPWQFTNRYLCLFSRGQNLERTSEWSQRILEEENCEEPARPLGFQPTQKKPLKGFRIALDPGHVGGTMAFASMEKKFVQIERNNRPEIHEPVAFNEGNLALGTAILLRDTLEKLGATVFMTREIEGHTAFDISFDAWLKKETEEAETVSGEDWSKLPGKTIEGYPLRLRNGAAWNWTQQEEIHGKDSLWWMTKATMRDVYKVPFLKADFKRRAVEINQFQPHISLIIHYNVWEKNSWSSGEYLNAIDDNYTMAFIPGGFMAGELDEPEDCMAFLAKAFSDDLPKSERLSGAVVKGFEKYLKVPIIPYDTSLYYLRDASLPTSQDGVFARNLSLTRMIQGPMCFGEALYQDNVDECLRLNRKEISLPGMETQLPARLKEAVNGYVEGVLKYVQSEYSDQTK